MQRSLMGPNSAQHMSCGGTANVALGKGRKRDRADQISDPGKREHFSKLDKSVMSSVKCDCDIMSDDIYNIVGKDGGLNNIATVDQLVHLMQLHQSDRTQMLADDVAWRTTLVGAIAVTDRDDCLNQLLQLGVLPLLDEWLQEFQRGKSGDGGSPKECSREVEDLLVTMLRALEKLPIDFVALKACDVWKSVNNLCSHKNLEIQRRVRKLLEVWKKQLDAEMQESGESKHRLNQSFLLPWKQQGSDSTEIVSKADLPDAENGKLRSAAFSASPGMKDRELLTSPGSTSEVPCGNSCQVTSNEPFSQNEKSKSTDSSWEDDAKNILFPSRQGMAGNSDSCPNDFVGKGASACQISSLKEAGFGKLSALEKSVSIEKLGNTISGSDNGDFRGSLPDRSTNHKFTDGMARPRQSLVHYNGNEELIQSEESTVDLPAPSITSSSLNMENGNTDLSLDNAVDAGGHIQSPSSSSEVVAVAKGKLSMEARQCSPLLRTGVCGDDKKQIECCTFHNPEDSYQSDLKTASSSMDTTRIGCPTDAKVQLPEYPVTSSSEIHLDSAFGRFHTPHSDLANVGINLLASVAASESSAIDGTGSDVISSRGSCSHEEAIVGNEGRTGIFQNVGLTKIKEKSDSLNATNKSEAGGETTDREQWEELHGLLETNSLPTKLEGKIQYESDHKGGFVSIKGTANLQTRQCSGTDTNSSMSPPLEDKVKADCNSTSWEVPSANESYEIGSSMFGIPCALGQYHSSEEETMDEGEKDTWTSEAGYTFSKEKESDSKESEFTLRFAVEDALEVARQVAKEVEWEMEGYDTTSPEERSCDKTLMCDHRGGEEADEFVSAGGHTQRASDGFEDQEMAEEPVTQSLSITTAPLLNLEKKLDEKIEQSLDDSPVTKLESTDTDIRDAGCDDKNHRDTTSNSHFVDPQHLTQSLVSCSHDATVVAGSSQQVLKQLPQSSHTPGISDQTVEGVKFISTETTGEKYDFDLNEGLADEEAILDVDSVVPQMPTKYAACVSSGGLAIPIAVVTATKGPFVLPASPLQTKGEFGWKGSAATSAFRPSEPRHTSDRQTSASESLISDVTSESTVRISKLPLDFDLNVANETDIQDAGTAATSPPQQGFVIGMGLQNLSIPTGNSCSNLLNVVNGSSQLKHMIQIPRRPALDLNCIDDSEGETNSASNSEGQGIGLQDCSSKVFSNAGKMILDFDLNDGPLVEDADEPVQPIGGVKPSGNIASLCVAEAKICGEVVNAGQWPQPMIPFSTVSVPALLPARPEHPYQVATAQSFSTVPSVNQFHCDINRSNAALSSSTIAHPIPQLSAYSYTGFPFGFNASPLPPAASFPVVSGSFMNSSCPVSFPAVIPSRIFSSAAIMPSHVQPPQAMGTQMRGSSYERAWARPQLDLNSGPDPLGVDSREERANSRQSLLGSLDETRRTFCQVINARDAIKEADRSWGKPLFNKQIWP